MFTGIIEAKGKIINLRGNKLGKIFTLTAPAAKRMKIKTGDSISLDGACFTVIKKQKDRFDVQAMPETLKLTISDGYKAGSMINIENPLKTGAKLSGHFVTGHIDCKGKIVKISDNGNSKIIKVKFPDKYAKFIAMKGSIALNGVSLTVSDKAKNTFSVSIIPYTIKHTNLSQLKEKDFVNIEVDLIARYLSNLNTNPKKR